MLAYLRRYYEENAVELRAKTRAHLARKRAESYGADGDWTPEEFAALCEANGHRCFYCGLARGEITVDHFVPLSRGGSNWITNIVPACRPCNSRKGAQTGDEFIALLDAA